MFLLGFVVYEDVIQKHLMMEAKTKFLDSWKVAGAHDNPKGIIVNS
jgi:hypothetical protein